MRRPPYVPTCPCRFDPLRNQPMQGMSPDEELMLREEALHFSVPAPYLFRRDTSV